MNQVVKLFSNFYIKYGYWFIIFSILGLTLGSFIYESFFKENRYFFLILVSIISISVFLPDALLKRKYPRATKKQKRACNLYIKTHQ